jgi:hypothetical protein
MRKGIIRAMGSLLFLSALFTVNLDAQCPAGYITMPAVIYYDEDIGQNIALCGFQWGPDYCCLPGGPQEQ